MPEQRKWEEIREFEASSIVWDVSFGRKPVEITSIFEWSTEYLRFHRMQHDVIHNVLMRMRMMVLMRLANDFWPVWISFDRPVHPRSFSTRFSRRSSQQNEDCFDMIGASGCIKRHTSPECSQPINNYFLICLILRQAIASRTLLPPGLPHLKTWMST